MLTITPRAALEHTREQVLDRQERRARVGGERLLPIRQVEAHDRGHRDVQGVVDEDVDLAESGRRLRDHRHQLVDHAQVALDEPGLASGGLDGVGDVLARRSLVHDHDPGAEGCHGRRGALADAASTAGHECGLSRECGPVEAKPVDKIPVDRVHVRLVLLPETHARKDRMYSGDATNAWQPRALRGWFGCRRSPKLCTACETDQATSPGGSRR